MYCKMVFRLALSHTVQMCLAHLLYELSDQRSACRTEIPSTHSLYLLHLSQPVDKYHLCPECKVLQHVSNRSSGHRDAQQCSFPGGLNMHAVATVVTDCLGMSYKPRGSGI